jgi:hypothetical protein
MAITVITRHSISNPKKNNVLNLTAQVAQKEHEASFRSPPKVALVVVYEATGHCVTLTISCFCCLPFILSIYATRWAFAAHTNIVTDIRLTSLHGN